ncbi:MAG TPA: glutamate--tRNA ligase, partial [Candidatus Paceibacterota bacterium]|nr:glutamate--tRNA ligase [Candidatus Paceibacterota bacterium]
MEASVPKSIRVRFAPSPTGPIHIGSVRTALFNWLFARKYGGTFILRIEDTDKERSEKKYDDELLQGLSWVGLDWDEGPQPIGTGDQLKLGGEKGEYGPYRQSERTEIYKKYLNQLITSGDAYYCYCSKEDIEAQRQAMLAQGRPPKYSGHCRNIAAPPEGKSPEVIRFKVPEIKVEFKDLVRGKVVFDAALFGDMIIAKDLDTPLYNFAVVVDDELMKISHVIRAEDHLSNTPKQILMQRALGFAEPIYAHIPLILNADRSKMSKRFTDVALMNYRDRGYVPEAMINFLAFLGWHPKGDKEVLSRKELIAEFDIDRVQQSGAIFNEEKLDWLNREHIKIM